LERVSEELEELHGGKAMKPATTSEDMIAQEVTIMAPAERIYAALTNPDELLKWWSAKGKFRATHVESDFRLGGRWSMRVVSDRNGDSSCTSVYGEFRAIEPPRLLIFTWIRDEELHPESLVRWDLDETDGVTTVRVTHSGLTSERWRIRNNGWPLILELLKTHLEKQN
jgi:uncharacterized protein YndB with AHSA1/START domain